MNRISSAHFTKQINQNDRGAVICGRKTKMILSTFARVKCNSFGLGEIREKIIAYCKLCLLCFGLV